MQKQRIWELDAFRGLFVLGMVAVHLVYDLQSFLGLPFLAGSTIYDFVASWGGVLFFLLSGICATLGSRPVRRGLIVIGCGLVVSAATVVMYLMDMADKDILIYFGVLHCLGVCMILWPAVKKLPWWALLIAGVALIGAGLHVNSMRFSTGLWLVPLGLTPAGFASSDYFPLLPFFGFFLLGAVLGKTLYKNKTTLFPRVSPENWLVKSFCWIGKWSLAIYILHQPILLGVVYALEAVL